MMAPLIRSIFSSIPRVLVTAPGMFFSNKYSLREIHGRTIDVQKKPHIPRPTLDDALPLSSMPGPGGLKRVPYIGTMFLFKPFSRFTLETFSYLVCRMHEQHGPVFKARLGKNYAVFTCNVEDNERIFRHESKYPERRLMNLSRVYRERCGLPQGLGTCQGEDWYALRKPLNVILKKPTAVQSYIPALNTVAEDFIERLLEISSNSQSEKAEEMFKLFFNFSSEGIGVVCFNQRLGFLARDLDNCPEKKKLLEAFRTSVACTFRDMMGLERRYLKTDEDKFYQTYYHAMRYIRQQSLFFVNQVLSGGSDEDSVPDDNNLLKTLVSSNDLSMEQVLAVIDSLLIGGTDSTARILTVLLYDMALNPEIQTRLAKEVRAFAGPNGPITSECVDKVRLLRACVKESMRVHYPVSCGIERILTRDMDISGYHVPSGTSVFMTGVKTCMDPRHFPNPEEFVPERWLRSHNPVQKEKMKREDDVSAITQHPSHSAFAFIPFGHGVRSCIGSRFAEMELQVGLAKIVQTMNISVHPSYKSLEVTFTPFITPIKPVPFVFTKR